MIELPLPRTTGALLISALLAGGLIAAAPPAVPSAGAAAGVPETFLVSRTQSATSDEPFLSADGQHVVFTSTAGDLADGDDNGVADVFLATAVPDKADPFLLMAQLHHVGNTRNANRQENAASVAVTEHQLARCRKTNRGRTGLPCLGDRDPLGMRR